MELEIKVMWCRGLTAFNFFQKLTLYAVVSINSDDQRIQLTSEQKQEQRTQVDDEGDGNPEWHYTMNFDLKLIPMMSTNLQNLFLIFQIRNHGQVLGDRNIGEVKVGLKDLVESVGNGVVRFASYEVKSGDGKHNGILDFSYKVTANTAQFSAGSENQITDSVNLEHNQCGFCDPPRIESSKIEFNEINTNSFRSTPPFLHYPPATTHYPPPPSYPPMWAPPVSHYPPPPPPPQPQHSVFPPPPPPASYGDPYWGYHRPPPPPDYQHYHHW